MDKSVFQLVDKLPLNERVELLNHLANSTVSLRDVLPNLDRTILPEVPVVAPKKRGRPKKETQTAIAPAVEKAEQYAARHYDEVELHIRPGDLIRVPAGTQIRFPDAPEKGEPVTQRARTVEVKEIYLGENTSNKGPGQPPTICWIGSGNYRRATSINNVVKVP